MIQRTNETQSVDKKICIVDGCEDKAANRNRYCSTHSYRIRYFGEPNPTHLIDPKITGHIVCRKCKKQKPVSEYKEVEGRKFGYYKTCNDCCEEHREIVNARDRIRRKIENPDLSPRGRRGDEKVVMIPYPLANPKPLVVKVVKLCSVDGCDRESRPDGAMCNRHHHRIRKYKTLDPIGFNDGKRICPVCNKEKTYDEFVSEVAKKINPTICNLCRKKESRKRHREKEKQRNPEKYKARQNVRRRNREAKIKINGGRHTASDILNLLSAQKYKCAVCKKSISKDYHVDHVMPLALGGSNAKDNLQLLCPLCNKSKHAKHPVDFMQELGFLI